VSCCLSATMDWRTHDANCKYAPDACDEYDRQRRELRMATNVPIVDQPEAYAKMREAAGLCSDCSGDRGAHFSNCPRIAAAFAQQKLAPDNIVVRFDAALRRIEALELEVARLKGPQSITIPAGTVIDTETLAGGVVTYYAPAVSYPPMPDEGT
jgi:hypothetical protein